MNKLYLGIDPGASGGLCSITTSGQIIELLDFSKCTPADIARVIAANFANIHMATMERVGSMPGQGVSSTFKFGHSAGMLEGILIACSVPYELTVPRVWQKNVGFIKPENATKTEHKRALKQLAQRLFPAQKGITNNTADAILIAEFCRRKFALTAR